MQHECPIDPSSMSRWRQRVGKDRLNEMLRKTIETAVQEKNITHPTDSKLLHKAIVKLSKPARQRGIPLRQS